MVMEDYLRAVLELEDSEGQCRVSELADHFGVTHVTVIRTVQRLEKVGLLETEPYRPLRLTPQGRRRAQACRAKFELAVSFLEAIGVPKREARLDADGIEHFLGTATTRQMRVALEQAGDRLGSPRQSPG
jgi:DtxR family manganese transport transcriptional regulator